MTDQYVPEDFQHELDIPSGEIDQAAAAKAQATLTTSSASAAYAAKKLQLLTAQRDALKKSAGAKGLSDKERASRQNALNHAEALVKANTTRSTAATAAQATAQNAFYEASGQFDKLLEGANRDAFLALKSMFTQYGLGSLANKIYDYAKQGYGADTISLLLQDTKEYKTRFAANDARAKAGLSVLSPAEYLSTESAYRQLMQDSGMPKGFYDNPADFQKWIASDVSPTEVKNRIDLAVSSTSQANPYVKDQLAALYGVDQSYLTAYFFDQTKSVPLLQKQQKTAEFAAEAARRGLLTDKDRFEGYITQGLSQSAAAQGFQTISEEMPNLEAIANRWGDTFNQVDAEGAVFGTSQEATAKKKSLASQERAAFSGSQGSSSGGLAQAYRAT